MTTIHGAESIELGYSHSRWIYGTSATAASLAGALFLLGAMDLIISEPVGATATGGLAPFQNNWLVVIFKMHAGMPELAGDPLQVFNLLDLGILALVAVMYLGLYGALRKTSRVWTLIALAQPVLGIGLFVATKSAGRSSVMGAGLVICVVMLLGNTFNKGIAWLGFLGSALLLAGDLSAGVIPPSRIVATLFGLGYILLIAWLFLVAWRLLQIGGFRQRNTAHV